MKPERIQSIARVIAKAVVKVVKVVKVITAKKENPDSAVAEPEVKTDVN